MESLKCKSNRWLSGKCILKPFSARNFNFKQEIFPISGKMSLFDQEFCLVGRIQTSEKKPVNNDLYNLEINIFTVQPSNYMNPNEILIAGMWQISNMVNDKMKMTIGVCVLKLFLADQIALQPDQKSRLLLNDKNSA